MTDLELTKRCASAIGLKVSDTYLFENGSAWFLEGKNAPVWDPLNDDADAMKLVRQCLIGLTAPEGGRGWIAWRKTKKGQGEGIENHDLKRAICLCAAEIRRPDRTNR